MAKDLENGSTELCTPLAFAVGNMPWATLTFVNCSSIILSYALCNGLIDPFVKCLFTILSNGLCMALDDTWETLFVISSVAMFYLVLHVGCRLPIESPHEADFLRSILRVATWLSLVAMMLIPGTVVASVLPPLNPDTVPPPPNPNIVAAIYSCTSTVVIGFYYCFIYRKASQEYLPPDSDAKGKITAGTFSSFMTNDLVATSEDLENGTSAKLAHSTPMAALGRIPFTLPLTTYTALLLCLALIMYHALSSSSRGGSLKILFAMSSFVMVSLFLCWASKATGNPGLAADERFALRFVAWLSLLFLTLVLIVEATALVPLPLAALIWATHCCVCSVGMVFYWLARQGISRIALHAEKKIAASA